jgi:hypothetical protein
MNPSVTLIQGMETVETIKTVLAATRIKSGPLLNALGYYFINGAKASSAYEAYGIS